MIISNKPEKVDHDSPHSGIVAYRNSGAGTPSQPAPTQGTMPSKAPWDMPGAAARRTKNSLLVLMTFSGIYVVPRMPNKYTPHESTVEKRALR